MARIPKSGLDYFPFNCDFFDSVEIAELEDKFGWKGTYVLLRLTTFIYKSSYFLNWKEKSKYIIARKIGDGVSADFVEEVVNELLQLDYFSKEMFKKYAILTSKRIQQQWSLITRQAKRSSTIAAEHLLIEENAASQKNNFLHLEGIISEEIPAKAEEIPQRKKKERKGKERKEKCVCTDNNSQESSVPIDEEGTHTHALNIYISKNHSRILQIPEQMTHQECEMLKADYGVKAIQEALIHLENKPLGKYQRVYNTLKIFCDNASKRESSTITQAALSKSAATRALPVKPAPIVITCEEALALQEERIRKQKDHLDKQDAENGSEKFDLAAAIAKAFPNWNNNSE